MVLKRLKIPVGTTIFLKFAGEFTFCLEYVVLFS